MIKISDIFGEIVFRNWEEIKTVKAMSWAEFRHYLGQLWNLSPDDLLFERIQAEVPDCENAPYRLLFWMQENRTAERPPTKSEMDRFCQSLREEAMKNAPVTAKPCQSCWGHHPLGAGTGSQGGKFFVEELESGKRYWLNGYQAGSPAYRILQKKPCDRCGGQGTVNEWTGGR